MILHHHDLIIELDDNWWAEAGMADFTPLRRSFRPNLSALRDETVFEVKIEEVAPLRRNPGVGIFNDNEEATARERVVRLLIGFRQDAAIPPILLVKDALRGGFRYRIAHGSHRFYCSLAAGFTHVSAVEGLDFWADSL